MTTSPGLEDLLVEELLEIGVGELHEEHAGAVSFFGPWELAAKLAKESRIASKILFEVTSFEFHNPQHLEKELKKVPWHNFMSNQETFKVSANGLFSGKGIKRSFAPLKCKDIICDHFRERGQERPSVDTRSPDIQIDLYFDPDKLRVFLTLHGRPLHNRGYRQDAGLAPLRENKAAALLRFAGFDPSKDTLVDPFCGSGTIVIEAARMALGIHNNISFSKALLKHKIWQCWDEALKSCVVSGPKNSKFRAIAGEINDKQIFAAEANAKRAGVQDAIVIEKLSALSWKEGSLANKIIVCNPPHGDRVFTQTKAENLLKEFARQLKFKHAPCRLALALSDDELYKSVGFKATRKRKIGGGTQALGFWYYDIY